MDRSTQSGRLHACGIDETRTTRDKKRTYKIRTGRKQPIGALLYYCSTGICTLPWAHEHTRYHFTMKDAGHTRVRVLPRVTLFGWVTLLCCYSSKPQQASTLSKRHAPPIDPSAAKPQESESLPHGVHLPRAHAIRRLQEGRRAPHVLRHDNPPDTTKCGDDQHPGG